MGRLDRLRVEPGPAQLMKLPFVIGNRIAPETLQNLDVLRAARPPPFERHSEIVEFLLEPAHAQTQKGPSAGKPIQGGHLLGGINRVALGQDANSRGELDLPGHGCRPAQGEKGIEHPALAGQADQLAILRVGVGRSVILEEQCVLAYPERIKAAFFSATRKGRDVFGRRNRIDGRQEESNLHTKSFLRKTVGCRLPFFMRKKNAPEGDGDRA